MQPNLKLVANANLGSIDSSRNAVLKLAQPAARNILLHPLAAITASPAPIGAQHKRPAYMLLAAVVGIHLAGITWLLSAAGTAVAIPPSKTELNTISVSLLSAPMAKPVLTPALPPKAKPAPKPVAKIKPVKNEIAKTEIAQSEIVTAQADAQLETNAVSTDLAPAAEPAPALAEASIEPPRFAAAYLHNPAPEYPQISRRMGEQGRVLLRVLVSSNGVADRVQIEASSGSTKLDEAALKAVEKWNFVPAKRSNQPVSAYVLVPVKFSLNS